MILDGLKNLFGKIKDKCNQIITKLKNKVPRIYMKQQTGLLDPLSIPKFTNQLEKPPAFVPLVKQNCLGDEQKSQLYRIDICEFKQQLLPNGFPKTTVWGYGGDIRDANTGKKKYVMSSPGATLEAVKGVPVKIKWNNKLTGKHLFAVDPTLHWANPNDMSMEPPKPWPPFPPGFAEAQYPVPVVTHLHGGEVYSGFDGHPDAWFTSNGKHGPAYLTSCFTYSNEQEATTLWYHDHALGLTRLNVYAGLAGFYLLRESKKDKDGCIYPDNQFGLPAGIYEIPIVIQDRMFQTDGSLYYNTAGINPDIHPYWVPEFLGNVIMVNGKVWPSLNVERRQYRFRFLNGSNARFYNLKFSNGMEFIQIGSDGGYLPKPVTLTSLLLAPAERADLLIDFSSLLPGTSIILQNDANAPYPDGEAPDPDTIGQIMQFRVPANASNPSKPVILPDSLNNIPNLIPDSPKRILTLNEVQGLNGPTEVLLNGQKWSAPITETPLVGSTEEWVIVNLTMDTHPIHLHLVQFLLKDRQDFDMDAYQTTWEGLNGMPPLNKPTTTVPVEPYLIGEPLEPDENERGWKDTVRMNPGQVTRILVRFAPQKIPVGGVKPGENLYPFNPSKGPGYVWHCHIIDHEDNEMMRPYKVEK